MTYRLKPRLTHAIPRPKIYMAIGGKTPDRDVIQIKSDLSSPALFIQPTRNIADQRSRYGTQNTTQSLCQPFSLIKALPLGGIVMTPLPRVAFSLLPGFGAWPYPGRSLLAAGGFYS